VRDYWISLAANSFQEIAPTSVRTQFVEHASRISHMMRKQRNGKKTRRQRDGPGSQMIPHPPQIQSFGIQHNAQLRFITNAAVNETGITFQNLLDALNVAASAVTAFQLFRAVKIRKVEMWATPVIGNATTVECKLIGNVQGIEGDTKIHSDTSMGIEPAHLVARPAPRSGLALFQLTSAAEAMILTCPSGTVIDVHCTFRGTPGVAVATQNVPAAAVPGAWYYRGLDGLAAAATVFVPVINASGAN
jgi:hypothetical protein